MRRTLIALVAMMFAANACTDDGVPTGSPSPTPHAPAAPPPPPIQPVTQGREVDTDVTTPPSPGGEAVGAHRPDGPIRVDSGGQGAPGTRGGGSRE